MRLAEIDAEIRELCPIDGVDSGGGIAFTAEATDKQRDAAKSKMAELLPSLELGPEPPSPLTATEKLAAFLRANPDVAALVS